MKTNKKKVVSALATGAVVASAVVPTAVIAMENEKEPVIQDVYEEVRELQEAKAKNTAPDSKTNSLDEAEVVKKEDLEVTTDDAVDISLNKPVKMEVVELDEDETVETVSDGTANEEVVNNEEKEVDEQSTVKNDEEKKEEVKKDKEENEPIFVRPPTQQELNARTGLDSNDDTDRREALEKEFNIKLTDDMRWEDKGGQVSVRPDGSVGEYTSHDELKKLGIYATNANRQELIQYALKTGDWQPYRAFEYKKTPGFFEVVNGKYEYNKVYYGHLLKAHIMNHNSKVTDLTQRGVEKDDPEFVKLQEQHEAYMNEYVKKFNEAPGITPYVPHLNHNEKVAEETGAKMYDEDFFESKYNHPDLFKGTIK